MNEIKIFENEQFGQIRTISQNGEPWFAGVDVAKALGYANTKDAILTHVDNEDKRLVPRSEIVTFVSGEIPNRGMTFINESGVYSLIFGSRLSSAKQFKHWVTSEIIPSIRKHGTYGTKSNGYKIKVFSIEQLNKTNDLEKTSPYIGFVYILEWGNKTKIGCSTNPSNRINQLKTTALYGGVDLGRIALTPGHTNYLEIENLLHRHYTEHRIEGTELFNLGFDEVLNSLPDLPLKDDSQRLNKKANAFTNFMKDMALGLNDVDSIKCPVCNEQCDIIYMDRSGEVFACDKCVIDQDSYTWNFEKHNRYAGGAT